jgi:hypothetical protein
MDHEQTRRAFLLSAIGVALGVGSAEAFGGTDATVTNRRRNEDEALMRRKGRVERANRRVRHGSKQEPLELRIHR